MSDLKKLRADHQQAEEALHKIQAEYETKRAALRDRYQERLNKAGEKAANLQKQLCDAEAAQDIAGRDELDDTAKRNLAHSLGLELP